VGGYRAAVVGCGRIGALFDRPGDEMVLTHAHAFQVHPGVELAGVVDLDPAKAREAARIWSCRAFEDLDSLGREVGPEIISLCGPTPEHHHLLQMAAGLEPKAVIGEKPLTSSGRLSAEMVKLYQSSGIALAVPFLRRFDPGLRELKKRLDSGDLGRIIQVRVTYTKGLLNNGSHAVDLLRHLLGGFKGSRVLGVREDHQPSDPTLTAHLVFHDCPEVFLLAADERSYSIFELDLLAEKGRYLFDQFGLRLTRYQVREDPLFSGYRDLTPAEPAATGLGTAMLSLVDNLVDHLDGRAELLSSGAEALQTQLVCEQILSAAKVDHL